jgi:hypothetical protein
LRLLAVTLFSVAHFLRPFKGIRLHAYSNNAIRSRHLFCPSGKSANPVHPPPQKYFPFAVGQIISISPAVLSRGGALAIVTNVGAGCGGRGSVGRAGNRRAS